MFFYFLFYILGTRKRFCFCLARRRRTIDILFILTVNNFEVSSDFACVKEWCLIRRRFFVCRDVRVESPFVKSMVPLVMSLLAIAAHSLVAVVGCSVGYDSDEMAALIMLTLALALALFEVEPIIIMPIYSRCLNGGQSSRWYRQGGSRLWRSLSRVCLNVPGEHRSISGFWCIAGN